MGCWASNAVSPDEPPQLRFDIPALFAQIDLLTLIVLAHAAYDKHPPPDNWSIVDHFEDKQDLGIVIINHSKSELSVVSFRGTQSLKDMQTDLTLALKGSLATFTSAKNYFESKSNTLLQGRRVYLLGHSLGGAIAGLMSTYTGVPAVLFDPPGCIVVAEMEQHRFLNINQTNILTIVVAPNYINSWGRHLGTMVLLSESAKKAASEANVHFDDAKMTARTLEQHLLGHFEKCVKKCSGDPLHFVTKWPNNVQSIIGSVGAEFGYDYSQVDHIDGNVKYQVSPVLSADYGIDLTSTPSTTVYPKPPPSLNQTA